MTNVTTTCTYTLLAARDGKMFSVATPTGTQGGDTFTVNGVLPGLKLTTVEGVLAQNGATATASALFNSTTVTIDTTAYVGATATAFKFLVWGTD